MRRHHELLLLLALASSSGALAGESPAFGPSTPPPALPAFEVCVATVRISGSALGIGGPLVLEAYVSDIMPRGPINDEDIRIAFEKFLADKYGKPSAAEECKYAYTREEAQKFKDDFRQSVAGQTFIETDWKYQVPAKAAAPPPEHYAVCWANQNAKVKYYSAVFDGSRDDAGKWWPAFQKYLKEKCSFEGPTQCMPAGTQADVQKYLDTLMEKDKQTRTMAGQPPQIVETGWKY